MDIINKIQELQDYYWHPFMDLFPNAILIDDVISVTHSSKNPHNLFYNAMNIDSSFFTSSRKFDFTIVLSRTDIYKDKNLVDKINFRQTIDLLVRYPKEDLPNKAMYFLIKDACVKASKEYTFSNEVLLSGEASEIFIKY